MKARHDMLSMQAMCLYCAQQWVCNGIHALQPTISSKCLDACAARFVSSLMTMHVPPCAARISVRRLAATLTGKP